MLRFSRLMAIRACVSLATLSTLTTPAFAHAHLKQAVPAAGATVSTGPSQLRLSFTEGVELAFSGVAIAMDDGMAIKPSAVALAPAEPNTILVTLTAPLSPGHYKVTWHVLSDDSHKTRGHYAFTVKK